MSTTIDQRVVEMRFDNKHFENNVQTSISTLDKLKQSLNLTGASKGLENINTAANRVNMSGLSSAIETVGLRFNAMYSIADQTFRNITNSAYYAGKRMLEALTIDPIKTGFQEYETQINAVQTILANTQSKGTKLTDVNKALDELNTYADKTIYNFTEMTRNIGTFTAAGVDLDTSVSAIQGIANLAAVSGSSSQQASTAMYQLSQALANGKVNLMDWNSVVNAGMGGEVFQTALKRTAKNMGTDVDALIKKYGSFRESLTKGEWLTTEVLTETLSQLAGAYTEKDLLAKGYTKEQTKEILELAKTAEDAATKVKTFTQLFDTLKEAAQSGWTQTWEIIVGDFEEAKSLLTNISNVVGDIINKSAEARNNLLQGWKDAGGRDTLLAGFKNIFESLTGIAKPIKQAFTDIFPPMTVKHLTGITDGFKNITAAIETFINKHSDQLYRTFKGIFSIADMIRKAITTVAKVIGSFLTGGAVDGLLDLILTITASIGDFFTSVNEGFKVDGIAGALTKIVDGISNLIGKGAKGLSGFGDELSSFAEGIGKVLGTIWDGITKVFGWINDNISAGDIFAGLTGGGIFLFAKKLAGLFDKIKDTIDKLFGGKGGAKKGLGIGEKFADILGSVQDALESFTSGIKIASLLSIAAAVAILSGALKTISTLKVGDITKSLFAMGTMFGMLSFSFSSLSKALSLYNPTGVIKAGISMMLMAKAMDILADAMTEISKLSLPKLAKGLVGVGGGILIMSKGLKAINGVKISVSTSIGLIALAKACKMLGDAMHKFGSMSWGEIARGLTGMGIALGEFVIALSSLSKLGGFKSLLGSTSLLIAVQSLDELSENLKKFGSMSWKKIRKGLVAMGGALTEVAAVSGILGKKAGFSGLLGSTSLVIAVQSLGELADGLKKFGDMKWSEIRKGLVGMGGALSEIGTVTGALGKLTGFSGILGGTALVIAVESLGKLADGLKKFGSMAWDEIGRGLSAMGGALLELGGVTGALGKLTGFSGLLGGGTLLIAVQSLGELADSLKKFGSMTWDEIGRGLAAMGGALLEVGGITGGLGYLTNVAGLLGSASIWVAVQGLGDLADALQKFGSMSWDEIGRGLMAMGSALGELAIGGFLNTLSIIGSYSISEVAEPLGVLADSVKKWSGVQLPEHLGFQLMALADGVNCFTFAGMGSIAISAVAGPLGVLAESVKKWTNVVVPEGLPDQLSILADGVKKFTFAGLGSSAIADAAPAVGIMADSIKKWNGISVPEGLKDQLSGIAEGIKAFSWAFMGGWSLSAIAGPLGELADDISKWKSVTIPAGLSNQLTGLADAIKSFSWAFMGGWSLSSLTGPLGKLADSVKKWKDVTIPEGLTNQLESLADAVYSFAFTFLSGWSIDAIYGPLGKLADSVKKWNDVNIPSGLGDKLKDLANGLTAFSAIKDVSSAVSSFKSIAASTIKLVGVNFTTVSVGLKNLSESLAKFGESSKSISGVGDRIVKNIVTPIKNTASQLSKVGSDLISSLSKGISSNNSVIKAMATVTTKMKETIDSKSETFNTAGKKLGTKFADGVEDSKSKSKTAMATVVKSALSGVNGQYDGFYTAGTYLVDGFAAGITDNTWKAEAKAAAMAEAAKEAAEEALGINSPSKVFYGLGKFTGIGFVNALGDFASKCYAAGSDMATSARDGLHDAIGKVRNLIDGGIDTQPTIRPVLDLDDIKSGVGTINGLFGFNPSIGVLSDIKSINSAVNRRNQNGANDDIVSAIDNLNKRLGNISNTTYNMNGINVNGNSDVEYAIKVLLNAAKVEGRA